MRRSLLLPLACVLAACATSAATRPAPVQAARATRPLLVFVHGRGHLDRDSAAVRMEWERSLRLGAGELRTGPLFDDHDVRLVWWADVLDPRSDEGCKRSDEAATATRGDSTELGWGIVRGLLGAFADAVDDRDVRSGMRGLIGDVMYLGDPWKRCGVERRLARALGEARAEGRPVVLVTHSLGAVVAYHYLRARGGDATPIQRWVTLGAPLGDPELRTLLLGDDSSVLRVPSAVRSWVNVVRDGDPFAAVLAPLVRQGAVTDVVRESISGDAHDLAAYLRDPEAARAVVWAWCQAFSAGAPAGCGKLGRDAR